MSVVVADVLDWMGITDSDLVTAATPRTQRVLDAVTSKVLETYAPPVLVDDPTDAQTERYEQRQTSWDQAIIMAAARLAARKSTVNGVMSFEGNGVMRVGRFDGDVEDLLEPFRIWGMA